MTNTFTRDDHEMIRVAQARGSVVVQGVTLATLICWKPKRPTGQRRQTARVEFANGYRRTFKPDEITLPTIEAAS